jgi:hypothetical protein
MNGNHVNNAVDIAVKHDARTFVDETIPSKIARYIGT